MRKDAASKSVAAVDAHTHLLALDPLLVNLADQGESTYLRLSITLQVEDAIATKDSRATNNKSGDDVTAAVRDTALTVLGQQTADSLLAPSGKEDLKVELLKALNEHDPDIKVKKILFTDFLVQR
ncbi:MULTISPECIES: flagellar basal body-associated protein FliL [Acidobacteriaceae]|uniref:flagellar basal body-associated FliL family protein n=1 Tax=Acidobacteriaceae TaxID=204434 RepID=UPI00131B50B9|nr:MULTISPECIES: flagellar basal body-associated FliL family protein [Acidobacteriaceae]MDW5264317.1 flagellar basal body-associated FliL family protein [Edaphobacter sp.]